MEPRAILHLLHPLVVPPRHEPRQLQWPRLTRPLLRILCLLAAAVLAGALTACGSVPAPRADTDAFQAVIDDDAYGAPVEVPTPEAIFAVSPVMKDFLAGPARSSMRQRGAQRGLVDALYRDGRVRIRYDASQTRTAAETFQAQAGNCLSLVVLTAALARELGLSVQYREVDTEVWEHHEDRALDLRIGHVQVLIGPEQAPQLVRLDSRDWLVVDFDAPPDIRPAPGRAIDERRIVSLLLNNLAGEALLQGDLRSAYWHARAAARTDAGSAPAWNTLGVVHSRRGDLLRAERSMREALRVDPGHDAAMGNLAVVLQRTGQTAEAALWVQRQQERQPEQPMALLANGLRALEDGEPRRAHRLLERALVLSGGSHEVHFALARAAAALGDAPAAARHLERAREAGPTPQARDRYAAKLARLREVMTAN